MSNAERNFDNVIEEIKSNKTYKKLKPNVFKFDSIVAFSDPDGYLEVSTKLDHVEFSIRILNTTHDTMARTVSRYQPYHYHIAGIYKDGKLTYSQYQCDLSCPKEKQDFEISYNSSLALKTSHVVNAVEKEINKDYNGLNDEEKTLYLLTHGSPLGNRVIHEAKELDSALSCVSERLIKRRRKVTVIRVLIGQWVMPDKKEKPPWLIFKMAANGFATYNMMQIYTGILLMFLQ